MVAPSVVALGSVTLTTDPYLIDAGTDFGAPLPVTSTVPNLVLDGSNVTGVRTDNRRIVIPVEIKGATRALLAQAEKNLALEVDKATNTLLITPASPGLPVVFDTFRGRMIPRYNAFTDVSFMRAYDLEIPAFPFARNPVLQTLASGSALVINNCDATTGTSITPGSDTITLDNSYFVTSTGSLRIDGQLQNVANAGFTSTFAAKDIHALSTVSVSFAVTVSDGTVLGNSNLNLTLSDGTYSYNQIVSVKPTTTYQVATFTIGVFATGQPLLNLSAITSLTLTTSLGYYTGITTATKLWYDDIRANPGTSGSTSTKQDVIRIECPGAYRTPAKFDITVNVPASQTLGAFLVHRKPGASTGYTPFAAAAATIRVNAQSMKGTYLVVLCVTSPTAADSTLTATCVITGDSQTDTIKAYYPLADIPNGLTQYMPVGTVTIPPREVSPDDLTSTVDVTVTGYPGAAAGIYLLDVNGQTIISVPAGPNGTGIFIDAEPTDTLSKVYLSGANPPVKTGAYGVNVVGDAVLHLDAGTNYLLVAAQSAIGGVALAVRCYPRYIVDRDI